MNFNHDYASTIASNDAMLPISMAYAPSPEENVYVEMSIVSGLHIIDALQQAGWLTRFPELNQWCAEHVDDEQVNNSNWWVGIFSQKKLLTYELQAHDRIEIYRPLIIDPMRKRQRRATSQ